MLNLTWPDAMVAVAAIVGVCFLGRLWVQWMRGQ
jgi:hypothetical protein